MMKILDKIKSKITYTNIGMLVVGMLIGWLILGGSGKSSESLPANHTEEDHKTGEVWTCSMHPQIRKDGPGQCPICGVELIPVETDEGNEEGEAGQYTVKLSNAAMKIAEVSMTIIEKKAPYKEVYLPGKVTTDERRISQLTSRFPGRIEKLFVNFTGQKVRKGQVLSKIYAPELVTAQKELFEAVKFKDSNSNYYKAARQKLKLWDLSEAQIIEIEQAGEVRFHFDVLSPISGTVTVRNVALGDYVKEGDPLFEVVNLSRVWVMFDAYESDLPWIKLKDKIKFTIKSIPGVKFEARVTFIDPVINRMTRVAGVRAEIANPKGLLKPQMLAAGVLKTMLPGSGDELVVPKSAVLWTGKKAIVYVMTDDHSNMFEYREIDLGADAGSYYVVKEGLREGEMVASNGVFKIDAAAQLKGEKSMMNPEGGKVSMGGHGNMDMGEDKIQPVSKGKNNDGSTPENTKKMDMSVDKDFQKQLTAVYKAQLDLQDAFLATDVAMAKEAVPAVEASLNKVNMSLLKGEMHNHWMASLKELEKSLVQIKDYHDIEQQRWAYADFNDVLYSAVKMFGTLGETIYYQFCPMARDGEGAYWLSPVKKIKNPYFGNDMLTCGETKETLK